MPCSIPKIHWRSGILLQSGLWLRSLATERFTQVLGEELITKHDELWEEERQRCASTSLHYQTIHPMVLHPTKKKQSGPLARGLMTRRWRDPLQPMGGRIVAEVLIGACLLRYALSSSDRHQNGSLAPHL